jgi:hypothetical protein
VARALEVIRARFGELSFQEGPLAELLGIPHLLALQRGSLPAVRARVAAATKQRALGVLARLLLLGDRLKQERVERALEPGLFQALVSARLVRRRKGEVAATASLFPVAGSLIATDRRFEPLAREPVMYLGGDSYALAYLTPREEVEAALDLCTGSGVQAVLAARHAERVVGVDVNPRALAFCRFNAALNQVEDRCRWVLADLDAALAPGVRFDLVLANPPFVPSPHTGRSAIAFRDGGVDGEQVTRRLVETLPDRLSNAGVGLVVTVVPEQGRSDAAERVAAWLGPHADVGAIWLEQGAERPEDYALAQVRRTYGDTDETRQRRFRRWHRALTRAGITQISGGVLMVRPHRGPSPPWVRTYRVATAVAPVPHVVPRLVRGHELAEGAIFPEELLDRSLRLADDAQIHTARHPRSGAGLETVGHSVGCRSMPLEPVGVGAAMPALLSALDGETSLRDAVGELDIEPPPGFDELLELVRRGALVPT